MRLINRMLLIIIIALPFSIYSQNNSQIDSLTSILKNESGSSYKADHFLQLYDKLMRIYNHKLARQYLDSVFILSKTLNYEKGLADYYNELGLFLYNEENYKEALMNYEKSVKLGRAVGDSLFVAKVSLNLGKACNAIGEFDRSLIYLKQSMRIAEKINASWIQKEVYDKLAVVYTFMYNYPEAIRCIERASDLAREAGDDEAVLKSNLNLGIIYKHQGNLSKALEVFMKALPHYETVKNKEMLISLDNCIGGIYLDLKEYPAALKHLTSALQYSHDLNRTMDAAINLYMLGLVYREQNDFDRALQNELLALENYTAANSPDGKASTLLEIGEIYQAKGTRDKAFDSFSQALKISEDSHDNYTKAACLNTLGKMLYLDATLSNAVESHDKYEKARGYLEESIELSRFMGQNDQIMNIYRTLYEIDSASGNYSHALVNYKLYSHFKDSLYNNESNKQMADLRVQFIREQKNQEINELTRVNEINVLKVKNQQAALLAAQLQSEINQNRIQLLDASKELQKLHLDKIEKQLKSNQAEFTKQQTILKSTRQVKDLRERELARQKLQRNGILFTTFLIIMVAVFIFRGIQLRRKLEKQDVVAKERERISADLHDDIGSGLSKIILMLEVLNKEVESMDIKHKTRIISEESLELSRNMSEVIWALNSRYDSLESLVAYIRKYASSYFENSDLHFKINTPAQIPQRYLSSEQRRNIFYVVKEALHNIMKHARATEAEIKITFHNQLFSLVIRDDGTGLPDGELNRFGNGIIQMRSRLEHIGGDFKIENHHGTLIGLSLPLHEK